MRRISLKELLENSLDEDPVIKPILQRANNLISQLVEKLNLKYDSYEKEILLKLFETDGGYDVQIFIRGTQYSFEEAEKLLQ